MATFESAGIGRIWERFALSAQLAEGGDNALELNKVRKPDALERINKVRLQIGKFAAVVPESLTFCFELVSRDTVASGALIEIESVGITARCDKCDFSFDVEDQVFLCPRCGEPALELLSGRELSVTSIEGETGEDDDGNQGPSCS